MTSFSISFIQNSHIVNVFRSLLCYENIRQNVDPFFLYDRSYGIIANKIKKCHAIAYRVKADNELVGCFLAFRKHESLFGHFFFRIFPNLSATEITRLILVKMVHYFDRKKIYVTRMIGEVPEWNHAAIHVCKRCGSVDLGLKVKTNAMGEKIEIRQLVYYIPPAMHCI